MKLTFIDVRPQGPSREREAARAKANAHVARYGHSNRPPCRRTRPHLKAPACPTPLPTTNVVPLGDESLAEAASIVSNDQSDATDTLSLDLTTSTNSIRSGSSATDLSDDEYYATQLAKYIPEFGSSLEHTPQNPWDTFSGGNSDPFACMPIAITPEVNNIIVFFHSRLLNLFSLGKPCLSSPKMRFHMTSQGLIYDTNIGGLIDECSSKSFLVFISAFRAKYADDERTGNHFRMLESQSQNMLRSKIQKSSKIDESILYSVIALFTSSVVSRDFPQATCHGQYLRTLLLAKFNKNVPIPLGLLKQALWADAQLALMRVQRSVLKGEVWVSKILDPLYGQLEPCLADLPREITSPESFDSTVSSDPLNSYIIRLRQCLALSIDPSYQFIDYGISSVLFLVCSTSLSELNFLNHYLDTTNLIRTCSSSISSTDRLRYHVEATISIALVYLVDRFTEYCCCCARFLSKGDKLLRTLQAEVSHLLSYISDLDDTSHDNEYTNAYIFVLFIEAQAERWQASNRTDGSRPAFDCECDVELARFAKIKGLKTWKDVRAVLGSFVFSDMIEPLGGSWIEEVLQRNDDV